MEIVLKMSAQESAFIIQNLGKMPIESGASQLYERLKAQHIEQAPEPKTEAA